MLRTSDKRLFIGQPVSTAFGPGRLERGPRPVAPPPVAGYTFWCDASQTDSVIHADGLLVAWLDLSGSDDHLARATATASPAYGSRTINGIIVPDFDGSTTYLTGAAPRDDRTSCTFVVCEADSIAAGVDTIVGSSGTGGLHLRRSANELQTSTSATLMAQLDNVVEASTPFVAAQNVTATDVTQYYNTTSETDANATSLTAGRFMEIGHNAVNDENWDGAIAEILYYPTTLSGGEVTSVITYLMSKWGIA